MLPDDGGGHGGGRHHRVSQSQRRGDSRQLRRAAGQRQVVRAGGGLQRQLEDRRVSGQRPVAERERQRRGDDLVHRQERTGPGVRGVLAGFGQDLRRADSHRRWRHARPRRYRNARGRIRARDLDRVRGSSAHSSGRGASNATAHARRRSRSPASPARARAATRAPRSPTARWCSPGPNLPMAAVFAFERRRPNFHNEAIAPQGGLLRVPAAGRTGGPDAAAPGTRRQRAAGAVGDRDPRRVVHAQLDDAVNLQGIEEPGLGDRREFRRRTRALRRPLRQLSRQRRQRQHRDGPQFLSESARHAAAAHAATERRGDFLFHRERRAPDRHARLEHRNTRG